MPRLIDGDELIEGYKHMGYDPTEFEEESYQEGWCKGFNAAVEHCISHVVYAPTVEPQRMSGKWIFYDCQDDKYDEIKCPFCHKCFTVDAHRFCDIGFVADDFKYCPNCGAWMPLPDPWKGEEE